MAQTVLAPLRFLDRGRPQSQHLAARTSTFDLLGSSPELNESTRYSERDRLMFVEIVQMRQCFVRVCQCFGCRSVQFETWFLVKNLLAGMLQQIRFSLQLLLELLHFSLDRTNVLVQLLDLVFDLRRSDRFMLPHSFQGEHAVQRLSVANLQAGGNPDRAAFVIQCPLNVKNAFGHAPLVSL